ncbi:hypothetical protein EUX98_g2650 [Antrodiella citrinella]|uniref:Uncharacterized protein n=1 Tax=Antrodiella citrinella TaxID=2447956 RepID=A0A4S4MYH1_9APHY|nr:hypothetical protein EUX98_g2650 [Antrodiella citrinella]
MHSATSSQICAPLRSNHLLNSTFQGETFVNRRYTRMQVHLPTYNMQLRHAACTLRTWFPSIRGPLDGRRTCKERFKFLGPQATGNLTVTPSTTPISRITLLYLTIQVRILNLRRVSQIMEHTRTTPSTTQINDMTDLLHLQIRILHLRTLLYMIPGCILSPRVTIFLTPPILRTRASVKVNYDVESCKVPLKRLGHLGTGSTASILEIKHKSQDLRMLRATKIRLTADGICLTKVRNTQLRLPHSSPRRLGGLLRPLVGPNPELHAISLRLTMRRSQLEPIPKLRRRR